MADRVGVGDLKVALDVLQGEYVHAVLEEDDMASVDRVAHWLLAEITRRTTAQRRRAARPVPRRHHHRGGGGVTGTEVTCRDVDTGESGTAVIRDDYLLVTDGRCYLDGVQRYANGTTVLTVKTRPEVTR